METKVRNEMYIKQGVHVVRLCLYNICVCAGMCEKAVCIQL